MWNVPSRSGNPDVKGLLSCDGIQFISRLSNVALDALAPAYAFCYKEFYCERKRKTAAFLFLNISGIIKSSLYGGCLFKFVVMSFIFFIYVLFHRQIYVKNMCLSHRSIHEVLPRSMYVTSVYGVGWTLFQHNFLLIKSHFAYLMEICKMALYKSSPGN